MQSHRALVNAVIYVSVSFVQKGVSFLLVPIYTRYLDAEQYGVVGLVLSVSAIVSVMYSLSVDAAATRFYFNKDAEPGYYVKCFGTLNAIVFLLLASSTVVIVLAGPSVFSAVVPEVPAYPYLILATVIAASSPLFQIYERLLRAKQLGRRYAVISLSKFALQALATVGLVVFLELGAAGLLLAVAGTGVVFFGIAAWAMVGDYGVRWNRESAKRIWSYTLPLLPNKAAAFAVTPIQNLLVGFFHNVSQVGLFHLGELISTVVNVLAQSIQEAYVPWAFEKLEMSERDGAKVVVRVTGAIVTFISLMALIGSLVAKEVFAVCVYGDLREAWIVFPYFAFFAVVNMVKNIWLMPLMYKEGGTKFVPVSTYINLALNVVLGVLMIPRFGIIGAAVSLLIARFLSSLVMMWFSRKVLNIGLTAKSVYLAPAICFGIALIGLSRPFEEAYARLSLALIVLSVGLFLVRTELAVFARDYKAMRKARR